uniref:Cytochrome c oxidase subunit 5B, mitochondrial n=1 Tax=Megaselia scalaris TaxID=36166 RepID=T1GMW5_MEGSC
MSDPLEHATGIEKRELLAKQAGNDNPFDMKVFKRGEEDQTYVQWMWLQKDQPRRCECGHWFQLVEKAPV